MARLSWAAPLATMLLAVPLVMGTSRNAMRELSDPATPQPQARVRPLKDLIQLLPKAELHLHVEGTLEPRMMLAIAERNNLTLPYANLAEAEAARTNYTSLDDFLAVYREAMSVLRTEADYYDMMDAYLEKAASQNVKHAEVFFDPQNHVAGWGTFFPGLWRAARDAADKYGMSVRLIMCFVRERSEAEAATELLRSLPYRLGILGVGLASSELGNPPEKFAKVYEAAGLLGLHKVAHAGEEGGPSYVWGAIRALHVERVDHGVHLLEDPSLVEYMAAHKLPVTLCPVSNLQLQVYKGQIESKIRALLATGIPVTLNSDDPAFFRAYVNENYEYVARIAALDAPALAALAKASFAASFMPDSDKAYYSGVIDGVLARWLAEEAAEEAAEVAAADAAGDAADAAALVHGLSLGRAGQEAVVQA